jgi:hypothetical protein
MWDPLIIDLVNYQLKNTTNANGENNSYPFEYPTNINNAYENRSPDEFKEYIENIFNNGKPFTQYQMHLNLRKRRKERYCSGYY